MTNDKCHSLENLVPIITKKLSHSQLSNKFENFRNELHHELVKQWPFLPSKSNRHPSFSSAQKATSIPHTSSQQRSTHVTTTHPTGLMGRLSDIQNKIVSTDSEISLENRQQRIEWNLKAQEGIVTYRLPDGLSDGVSLHNKLQKLMKTDIIYLNDRQFWTTLENRFKDHREENFHQNMEKLRRSQEEFEHELVRKGSIPYSTEEAIRLHAEEQRALLLTNPLPDDHLNRKNCFIDDNETRDGSKKKSDHPLNNEDQILDAFEADNVHPRFHQILTNYPFQSSTSENIAEKYQDELKQNQAKIKTIFPKINQRDRIRQELDAMKTSEGLYAYSHRLAKKMIKSSID